MREIKNIFSSIYCVIKIKPSYLIVKIFSIITSVITALIPVMVVKEIVNLYYENQNIGKIAVLVGISFLALAVIYLINFIIVIATLALIIKKARLADVIQKLADDVKSDVEAIPSSLESFIKL